MLQSGEDTSRVLSEAFEHKEVDEGVVRSCRLCKQRNCNSVARGNFLQI